jgi:uncharacterized membrane protein
MSTPDDDDTEYSSVGEARAAERQAVIQQRSREAAAGNPARTTLVTIGVIGLVLGAIILIWGAVAINSYGTGYPVQKDTGATQLLLGGGLFSLGITALLILAGAQTVISHLQHGGEQPAAK